MEFESFRSIEILESPVVITEKIDGTNAQIVIGEDGSIRAGSRNRWITPEDDNYGFAKWVEDNSSYLRETLGVGRHFGEWYGAGINAKYGLKEKRLALFNTHRWNKELIQHPSIDVVPILYNGLYKPTIVGEVMSDLAQNGSKLVPGFMFPEGIVILFLRNNALFKNVFHREDVGITTKEPKVIDPEFQDKVNSYLQPLRLKKLLSRDEKYLREYPVSLPNITRDYIQDLLKETDNIDEVVLKGVKGQCFKFVKENI